ncbi:MAG: NADH-quinone oxidoreductase subunit E [Nitrospirae bacterium]|nr:MAG: NADH-quinone oxidoreductase subunit E [Nitrospirota bacterium]
MQAATETHATPAEKFANVCSILEKHGRHPARLIPILQAVQEEYGYLPEEVLAYVGVALDVPAARVYGVATFYAHFALEPRGKYIVRLCNGTACHVKKSIPILDALYRALGVTEKKPKHELITIEIVACLGACGLAPVLVINEDVYGQMTPARAAKLIDEILEKEAALV